MPRVAQTASHQHRGTGGMFSPSQPTPGSAETEPDDSGDNLWESDTDSDTEEDTDYFEAWDAEPKPQTYDEHEERIYQARCEKLNIEMHPRAIPDTNSSTGNEIQATLDGVVVAQPRPTVFTSEGLHDFLIEMIVTQDEAIDVFVRLADDSDEVPDLRDKQYRNYMLTKQEWTKIEVIHEALREPADVTQTFSSERTPTVWRIIPTLEFLIKRWETMSTQPKFAEIEDTLLEGVKSLKKWFHRAETTSGAYFICLVLNPGIKDVYFHAHWGDEEYKAGMEAFEEAFDRYSAANHDNEDTEMSTAPVEAKPAPLARYGSSFLMDAVNSVQQAEQEASRRGVEVPEDHEDDWKNNSEEDEDNGLYGDNDGVGDEEEEEEVSRVLDSFLHISYDD
ncbi:hypothetical protein B0H10DRAFT_2232796 [Mycena sp. CBHHK59/15]|nr:hypothetical protein B0H10DRAFT_2232796 [Mycena sp. CBHHK59/15]